MGSKHPSETVLCRFAGMNVLKFKEEAKWIH